MTIDNLTPREQLLYVTAQEFNDGEVVFTGFHWPVVAQRVARRLHAPNLLSIFEAGINYGGLSERLSTSTTELGVFDGHVDMYSNSLDTLQTYLKSGRLDGAVVDAANVDRFGNINSTTIGSYESPSIRLPGPGGARDILSYGEDVTLVCGSSNSNRYHERVPYVTSPGHLDGYGSREDAGFKPGTGPSTLITPHGRFVFDDTGRAQLDSLARNATVEDVRRMTGWDIPDGNYDSLPLPDQEELTVVREEFENAADRGYTSVQP